MDAISSEPQQITPTLLYGISYCLIAFPLTPKHVTLNDLELPFCLKFCFVPVCLLDDLADGKDCASLKREAEDRSMCKIRQ